MMSTSELPATVEIFRRADLPKIAAEWDAFAATFGYAGLGQRSAWAAVLARSLGHEPYFLCVRSSGSITGLLPLVLVRSLIFGRFLVSLSYVNSSGVLSSCPESTRLLLDRAVQLADELQVRSLELRQEQPLIHPRLVQLPNARVHMQLALPGDTDALMASFKSKLRSQVKKALSNGQTAAWGREDLLAEFYAVFSRNMRDLGTPAFPLSLFRELLAAFPAESELCVMRHDRRPVAAAVLLHGPGTTLVPSASALREFNSTNANMRLYWELLTRAIERGQSTFDFGRSSPDTGPYHFKAQWGAEPIAANWCCYLRQGQPSDMQRGSEKFDRAVRLWKMLPLFAANRLGPWIVRGIP